MFTRLAVETRTRMRWRNDQGWTTEIARGSAGPDAPDPAEVGWRVSVAEIEADSDFSTFDGMDRSIVALDGAGLVLVVDKSAELLVPGRAPRCFPGEATTFCKLLAGSTRDLNVMTRRGVYQHHLALLELECASNLLGPGGGAAASVEQAPAGESDGTASVSRASSPHDLRVAQAELLLVYVIAGDIRARPALPANQHPQPGEPSTAPGAEESGSKLGPGDSVLCDEPMRIEGQGSLAIARIRALSR